MTAHALSDTSTPPLSDTHALPEKNTHALSEKNTTASTASASPDALQRVVDAACARVAPSWPLDRFIAVNPFWGFVDAPLPEVAARLRALSGAELLMPRSFYREAYQRGEIRDEHLLEALTASDAKSSLASLRALLDAPEPTTPRRARVLDVLDATRDEDSPSWRDFVIQSVSQLCAAYFDDGQADFGPSKEGGLYALWRRHAVVDRNPAWVMGERRYAETAATLPETAPAMIAHALETLRVPEGEQELYLLGLLLDVNGWASVCAHRRWTARLEGRDDHDIVDLLAIRIGWEWMLHRLGGAGLERRWLAAMDGWPRIDEAARRARPDDWLLQSALEIAWRAPVIEGLHEGLGAARAAAPRAQAVFCIDVRSEVFRRALEATTAAVQTLGFAGFFGLPIEYAPLGGAHVRPQLPGLLRARLRATDTGLTDGDVARRQRDLALARTARSFKADPVSAFSFVEALGATFAAGLVGASFAGLTRGARARLGLSEPSSAAEHPRLVSDVDGARVEIETRCELALGMLRGMSLTRDLARLVLLVGHGSTTRNNPHAAGLDCGACCGQTGEVNARVGAALLNDPLVRKGLSERGVTIPESTRFVAALHDTTTDEVTLYELDELPASHREDAAALRGWLDAAAARARAERAPRLGLRERNDEAIAARARDWSQVRPEWGLADNAAFIVAPREHCRHLDLGGRSFLHEYRHEEDPEHRVLEQIMTAPMIVTHWINFQYYASTVDNLRYGSGNKVLHNVVGGHLGVFEGNTGDLRIGLPLQSLHDGRRWVHTPRRLSVFLEAPRAAIDAIVARHETVRALVEHGWLFLLQIDEKERAVYERRASGWERRAPKHAPPSA